MKVKVRDHKGNEFSSAKELCEYYNIPTNTYFSRIRLGWSVEEALTTPIRSNKICVDHLGNTFNTVSDMCRHWSIGVQVFHRRMYEGWPLDRALTEPPKNDNLGNPRVCRDHLGNNFESLTKMCEYWGIDLPNFQYRKRQGWSLEKALTTPITASNNRGTSKPCKDHLGKVFNSKKEMCEYWGIPDTLFDYRKRLGWSLEKALTTPVRTRTRVDHLGNTFKSQKEMCEYWGISASTFNVRMEKLGWSLEKSLTTPIRSHK